MRKRLSYYGFGLLLIIGAVWQIRLLNEGMASVLTFAFVFSAFYFIVDWLFLLLLKKRYSRSKLQYGWWISFMVLFVLEIVLRYGLGTAKQYDERNGSFYHRIPTMFHIFENHWRKDIDPRIKRNYPNGLWINNTTDFTVEHQSNSLGFRTDEYSKERLDTSFTILALGDSFTEGVGVEQGYAWLDAMEAALKKDLPNALFYNAGISGSDVVFEIYKLKNLLMEEVKPDWVILCFNESDISDLMERGGNERFLDSGVLKFRSGVWYSKLFASSHIFRAFAFLNGTSATNPYFGSQKKVETLKTRAVQELLGCITNELIPYLKEKNVKFAITENPLLYNLKNDFHSFDEINSKLKEAAIYIDLIATFQEECGQNCDHLFWPVDRHNNVAGYKLIGETVAEQLRDTLIHDYNMFSQSQKDSL